MALEFLGNTSQIIQNWIINPLMWIVLFMGVLIAAFGFFYLRKKMKLVYPVIEIVNTGSGKTNINNLGKKSAGWFGKELFLFGLFDRGDRVMKTKFGEVIHEFSEEDFQEVNGSRGIIMYKDPSSGHFFPINKLKVVNEDLIAAIAPADYVQTGIDAYNKGKLETQDRLQALMEKIILIFLGIVFLIAIIVIVQYAKNTQAEAAKVLFDAGKTCMENARQVCTEIVSTYAKSSAAP